MDRLLGLTHRNRSAVEPVFVAGLASGDTLLTFGQAVVGAGDPVRVLMEPTS